jgi:hypothetical protein
LQVFGSCDRGKSETETLELNSSQDTCPEFSDYSKADGRGKMLKRKR